MERRLKALFAFQRFEKRPKLDAVIRETLERYSDGPVPLSDEMLEHVAAAGELYPDTKPNKSLTGGDGHAIWQSER